MLNFLNLNDYVRWQEKALACISERVFLIYECLYSLRREEYIRKYAYHAIDYFSQELFVDN